MSNLTRPELVWRLADSERKRRELETEIDRLRRENDRLLGRAVRRQSKVELADSRYPG